LPKVLSSNPLSPQRGERVGVRGGEEKSFGNFSIIKNLTPPTFPFPRGELSGITFKVPLFYRGIIKYVIGNIF
jgi:hypothetical protein